MNAGRISTPFNADPVSSYRVRRLIWIGVLLIPALVAISCNFPLAASLPVPEEPPPSFWWTPTPADVFTSQSSPDRLSDATSEILPDPPNATPDTAVIIPTTDPATSPPILYYTQAGDTLPVVAKRFGVNPEEITSPVPIPQTSFINPDQLLLIPSRLSNTTSEQRLLPDSELVFSPSSVGFDVIEYVNQAGGHLSQYTEYLGSTGDTSGAEIVARVAAENSINPRLLLALLEYQSHWVHGEPQNFAQRDYPLGKVELNRKDLYKQLTWAVNQLAIGYYGWREGLLTEITFKDGTSARLSPTLNSGTVALQYYFAQLYDPQGWASALDPANGFPALHEEMFGNPWVRALSVEPLFPPDLSQPEMILPFVAGQLWAFTGGPHGAWERDGAQAALDFAPGSTEPGCIKSNKPAVAAAPGLVVRAGNGVVLIDLDGDGLEQTGWGLLYLHVSDNGLRPLVTVGQWVETGDHLGYPSCEGGLATGTHIHIARKYNGEWMPADGPLPFVLSGWVAHVGARPYLGTLTRDGQTVTASPLGTFTTRIMREKEIP